ncbi:hypothetical protein, partial [Methanorbis furvi]|uniref:hypothetical protein n=1 Tax=Methanorbis furvi TaxID=3028299 RepID=UPI0030B8EB60
DGDTIAGRGRAAKPPQTEHDAKAACETILLPFKSGTWLFLRNQDTNELNKQKITCQVGEMETRLPAEVGRRSRLRPSMTRKRHARQFYSRSNRELGFS